MQNLCHFHDEIVKFGLILTHDYDGGETFNSGLFKKIFLRENVPLYVELPLIPFIIYQVY